MERCLICFVAFGAPRQNPLRFEKRAGAQDASVGYTYMLLGSWLASADYTYVLLFLVRLLDAPVGVLPQWLSTAG